MASTGVATETPLPAPAPAKTLALTTLMKGLVDYAGLFPPATLPMERAVADFAQARRSPHSWALARFIVPMKRLGEFASIAAPHLQSKESAAASKAPSAGWLVSVLIDGNLESELEAIAAFNQQHEVAGASSHKHVHIAEIDTLEIKVKIPEVIDEAVEVLPEELFPFFELPIDSDFRGFAAALAGTGFGAKLRTGGTTAELIPPPELVADFLLAMHACEVPFKATAGLHHPVRGSSALTYEPGSPTSIMHGFANVFLAACFVRHAGFDRKRTCGILAETNPGAFVFADAGVTFGTHTVTTEQIRDTRENFAICFGSCSFAEPVADCQKLGWF